MPVEGAVPFRKGAENTIEEEKSNPKILVHSPVSIQRAMMNVVEPPGLAEPPFKNRCALHPEILDVHPVMQVAEHEYRPSQQGEQ